MKNNPIALLVIVPTLAACSYRIAPVPTQHIVMVESTGRLMDPTGVVDCKKDPPKDEGVFLDEKGRSFTVPLPRHYSWEPCDGSLSRVRNGELD